MIKYNLHTHSFYCGHGEGEIKDYADYADEKHFDILGFSEHCPFPDDLFHSTRMAYKAMGRYLDDVDRARSEHKTIILKGFECDYLPKYRSYFEDLKEKVDYLIAGTHFMISDDGISNPFDGSMRKKDLFIYASSTIKAMESGLFSFFCHPDVFLSHYPFDEDAKAVSKDIIALAKEMDMPLEVNANGIAKADLEHVDFYRYPRMEFFALVKAAGVKCVKSSDAHKVVNLDKYSKALDDFIAPLELDFVEPAVCEYKNKYRLSFK